MGNVLKVYGCGGCGVNIAQKYLGMKGEKGCAEISPALIDASSSNLRDQKKVQDSIYLVEGLDGSGKIRSENSDSISKTIKQILVKIPPTEMNVVVFSAGGGSGSVIGPLLIAELNARKIPCIALVVGSDDSVISAENTLKTLQSLEAISKKTQLPVVMSYHKYDVDAKRSDVDKAIWSVISCLSILASGENLEMDYRDLVHWVQYTKVNGGDARLSTMHVATSSDQMDRISAPISVASLYQNPDCEHHTSFADYQSVGYADLSNINIEQVHFAIAINDLATIGKEIKSRVNDMMEERESRLQPDSLLDGAAGIDSTGLVL